MAGSNEPESVRQTSAADSDVTFDYVCRPCGEEDKTLEAVGFCVDCSEFLCDECFRYHRKPLLTRHHKLLDIEEAKKDTSLSPVLDSCTEKCAQHRGKTIEYLCLDHDCFGCGVCITVDHRNCQGVQYIPKIAENTANGEEFSSLMRQLDMVLLQVKILIDTSTKNKLKSQSTFDKALNHVKQVRKDVNEAIDKLEREIETEAEQIKLQDWKKMDEHIESCKNIEKKTEALTAGMTRMKQKGQHCNLFVAMKTNKNEMKSMVQVLVDIGDDISVSEYMFQPSKLLEDFLEYSNSHGQLCRTGKSKTIMATKSGEICVKVDSDTKACNIYGLVMINYDRIVAADWENNKVKLIDTKQSKVISEYELPGSPCDITTTWETDEISVTVPNKRAIFILKDRNDKLYEDRRIKTTGLCYGIACIKDKFVVSLASPERLQIIDKQGNILQTIQKDEQGEQLFGDVWSVAVSQDTGTIYVPDHNKSRVNRLSLSGQVHGIYEDSDMSRPRGVAIGKRGAVYICDSSSSSIHHITQDHQKISILLTKTDGLPGPKSMCYDENTDRLYVGQCDKVLVYQLSKA